MNNIMPVLQYRFRLRMKSEDDFWTTPFLMNCEIDYIKRTISMNIREPLELGYSNGLEPIPRYPKEIVIDYFDGKSSEPHRGELFCDAIMVHCTRRLDYNSQEPAVNHVIYKFK